VRPTGTGRGALAIGLAALALALPGCGGGANHKLVVSAASSLKGAFTAYQPDLRYSFAGSDQLAAQIRAGARPDVYAAADTDLPERLYRSHLVERPVVFARNRLVLATKSARIRSIADAARPGVTLAMGSPAVPAGAYARRLLAQRADGRGILANVKSEEPDVAGVVGKVAQGAVAAGFVYLTDARAAKLRAIDTGVEATYAVAIVKPSAAARRFVQGLLSGAGRRALLKAGFH
jgi:molybdate transport system substrate-binding protein